jgi:hypothetical protein
MPGVLVFSSAALIENALPEAFAADLRVGFGEIVAA